MRSLTSPGICTGGSTSTTVGLMRQAIRCLLQLLTISNTNQLHSQPSMMCPINCRGPYAIATLVYMQVNEAAEVMYDLVDANANLIFGAVVDPQLSQEVRC